MKLKKLIKDLDLEVKGSRDIEITGVCANSKLTSSGNLFIAKKGQNKDGRDYIEDALASGAAAIVTSTYNPFIEATQIIAKDTSSLEAPLAARFYEHPCQKLLLVGVTGSKGKTTTSFIFKHLFDQLMGRSGLIGTISHDTGRHQYQAENTTPGSSTCQKLLKEMVMSGCSAAVMEVSSHALDQNRVDEIVYDFAIFTNLENEHLDYHGGLESYKQAKWKLFTKHLGKKAKDLPSPLSTSPKAVINYDSPYYEELKALNKNSMSYGLSENADLYASDLSISKKGLQFTLHYQGQSEKALLPLLGKHNVYNALAAAAPLLSLGAPLEKVAQAFRTTPPICGRLEKLKAPLQIYVDFAHTEESLRSACLAIKEQLKPEGKFILVFGCGGDRDKEKRKTMGKVAQMLADYCIITSDNPRNEDPLKICQDIASSLDNPHQYHIEIDRRKAIATALDQLKEEDVLLIAGKGHETHQVIQQRYFPFRDQDVTLELLKEKLGSSLCHQ